MKGVVDMAAKEIKVNQQVMNMIKTLVTIEQITSKAVIDNGFNKNKFSGSNKASQFFSGKKLKHFNLTAQTLASLLKTLGSIKKELQSCAMLEDGEEDAYKVMGDLKEEYRQILEDSKKVEALKNTELFGSLETSYTTINSEFPDHSIKLAR